MATSSHARISGDSRIVAGTLFVHHKEQGWESCGSVRLHDSSPTEISRTRSCLDIEKYFRTGSGSGSVSSIPIVGRVVLC